MHRALPTQQINSCLRNIFMTPVPKFKNRLILDIFLFQIKATDCTKRQFLEDNNQTNIVPVSGLGFGARDESYENTVDVTLDFQGNSFDILYSRAFQRGLYP